MPRGPGEGGRPSGASVSIESEQITKRQDPERTACEQRRTQSGMEIAERSGLFRVPEVLSCDPAAGVLTLKRCHDVVPLRKALAQSRCRDLARRAGEILAAIHSRPDDGSGLVEWHGDFAIDNILYAEQTDDLIVIDWSNAHWTGEPTTREYGPAGLDLGVFLVSLFNQLPLSPHGIPERRQLAQDFLEGYTMDGASAPVSGVGRTVRQWRVHMWKRWGLFHCVTRAPSLMQLERFVRGQAILSD